MAAKNRPYEQFGSFILFKKLETDGLGDLWRAGRIEEGQRGSLLALRRLSGGNREAFARSAASARQLVPQLTGTSFAKHQEIDVVNGTPYIAHEYSGGRSLRHILDRARGGNGVPPNPLPIDQAIVIAEKVALSLATTADLKMNDKRLAHGALVPHFIWITDDGEIRVAGQQLGGGFLASMSDAAFAGLFGRYFSPEYRSSGEPSKASEVFSMGAILYLLIAGNEPPDAMTASAFMLAIRGAKTMGGQLIPDDIRVVLDKSLNLDINARYASVADMKQALSALAHGGKYSATTFNLAFYLSNLLKKEMEGEALDRDKESKVNVAAYLEQPAAPAPAAAAAEPDRPMFGVMQEPKKSKAPLAAAAIAALAVIGIGGWWMTRSPGKPAPAAPAQTASAPMPQKTQVLPTAVVAAAGPSPTTATATTTADAAAQKKAFEAAVEQKLQQEMMKLQSDYTNNLQKNQARNAPVQIAAAIPAPAAAPAPARVDEHPAPSPSTPDERRPAATRTETPAPVQPQPAAAAPAPAQEKPAPAAVTVPQVHDGDVIDYSVLDSPVNPLSSIRPAYPPLAQRNKVASTVILTALIDEGGNVVDVKVLKGDDRFGFNDAAIRAIRTTRFSAPVKDGHHVKTWRPQTIMFQ